MIWGILKSVVGAGAEVAKGWQQRKKVKLENELAVAKATTEAKIERMKTRQEADIKWENTALVNTGIKDEVMMFVILAPMVMCFVPGGADVVREGFSAMKETLPEYWEYAFYATIGVSYGLKKWTDFKSIMKG